MEYALIIIDLQNDFLSEKGTLGKGHIKTDFLNEIEQLINFCKSNNILIIWIKSIYKNNNETDIIDQSSNSISSLIENKDLLLFDEYEIYEKKLNNLSFKYDIISKTHNGKKKFCIYNSYGSKLHDNVLKLVDKKDILIIKNNYSAFIKTNLNNILKENNINNLIICGVTANTCVKCTSLHAYLLNYNVSITTTCIKSINEKKYNIAVKELNEFCKIYETLGDIKEFMTTTNLIYY